MFKKFLVFSSLVLTILGFTQINPDISIFEPKLVYASREDDVILTKDFSPSVPVEIYIPSIDLNTGIVDVGITKEGNLDVPPNYTQVGWYKYGTLPGEVGSAVLDGHVDNGALIPGPFKNLKDVKEGDEIFVLTENGITLKYTITSIDIYDTNKFPGEFIFHDKSGPLLKLITCHGKYIKSLKTYDKRLVVTGLLS
jgi:LPXTG-site transpeptidase (sortase) family protein